MNGQYDEQGTNSTEGRAHFILLSYCHQSPVPGELGTMTITKYSRSNIGTGLAWYLEDTEVTSLSRIK